MREGMVPTVLMLQGFIGHHHHVGWSSEESLGSLVLTLQMVVGHHEGYQNGFRLFSTALAELSFYHISYF